MSERVQGRHPLQASDAIGAAAVQVGPEANRPGSADKQGARIAPTPMRAAILQQGFGLTMSRSGICRAIQRVAAASLALAGRSFTGPTLHSVSWLLRSRWSPLSIAAPAWLLEPLRTVLSALWHSLR